MYRFATHLTLAALLLAVTIPVASAAEPLRYNRVSLNESAQIEVDNDLLVAVLVARAEGKNAVAPADEVNRIMDRAVKMARSEADVKVQTLGYNTHPVYNKNKIRGWRVSQSLRLESTDSRVLGDLVARLQEKMQVQSLGYRVSDEQRRHHLDGLTDTALQRFRARASAIAKTMGRDSYRLVQIHINDGQRHPTPVARGMMMDHQESSVASARIEAGTQTMTVSINGEIELSER